MCAGRRGVNHSCVATMASRQFTCTPEGNLCRLLHWRPESDRAWLAREQSPPEGGLYLSLAASSDSQTLLRISFN